MEAFDLAYEKVTSEKFHIEYTKQLLDLNRRFLLHWFQVIDQEENTLLKIITTVLARYVYFASFPNPSTSSSQLSIQRILNRHYASFLYRRIDSAEYIAKIVEVLKGTIQHAEGENDSLYLQRLVGLHFKLCEQHVNDLNELSMSSKQSTPSYTLCHSYLESLLKKLVVEINSENRKSLFELVSSDMIWDFKEFIFPLLSDNFTMLLPYFPSPNDNVDNHGYKSIEHKRYTEFMDANDQSFSRRNLRL